MLIAVVHNIEAHGVVSTADVVMRRGLLHARRSITEAPSPGDDLSVRIVRFVSEQYWIEALQNSLLRGRPNAEIDAWKSVHDHAYVPHYV